MNYTPKEPYRSQDVTDTAGSLTPESQEADEVKSVIDLVRETTEQFMTRPIVIVEGLEFNHYQLLTTIHYYLNSRFETGDLDENGDERYFHNIITPRNAHATKNIDLDSKDMLVTADSEQGWWFSFLLRNELQNWMRKPHVQFGKLLNDLVTNLPNFGKVIWKRCGVGAEVYLKEVDLRDAIFDPSASSIRTSGVFVERSIVAPWDAMDKVKEGYWDKDATIEAIRTAQAKKDKFLKEGAPDGASEQQYSLSDTLPSLDAWEIYGWFPRESLDQMGMVEMTDDLGEYSKPEDAAEGTDDMEDSSDTDDVDYVYAKAVVLGIEDSEGHIVHHMELDPKDFPYYDFNYFRRVPGRCLPIGNAEALIPLQVRMNELVNRFFAALRIGSLHIYQTRSGSSYKNLSQDAQDGDIIETKSEITPIATELRAFQQYQVEINNIDRQADLICNTPEIVTGDNLPTNTPFRLGAQMNQSANKIFDQVREDIGLTLTYIFENWILPEIMEDMSEDHILDVAGSVEELKMFDEQNRKYLLLQQMKDFIMRTERHPTDDEWQAAEQMLAEQLSGQTRKVKINKKYFTLEKMRNLRVYFDVTDERKNFAAEKESMSNLLTIVASNPMILENPDARVLMSKIMEASGLSPLMLSSFASKPTNPNAQMNAAPPAADKFSQNPGDAGAVPPPPGAPVAPPGA